MSDANDNGTGGEDGFPWPDLSSEPPEEKTSLSLGILVFVFGAVGGFLLAFSALEFLEDSMRFAIAIFVVLLVLVATIGLVAFIWRKSLMRKLFGTVETQIQTFAEPLSNVAKSAANRDPLGATQAARILIQRALARYAWMSTRRWVIASLTGLIAAMAALAGTTLLFRQNQLIAVQSELLREQNVRIGEQTDLLKQDVELAEAARNAELAVEITQIGAELGKAIDRKLKKQQAETGITPETFVIPIMDPQKDLDPRLVVRIAAASRSVKPYRFLNLQIRENAGEDDTAGLHFAMRKRKADLPIRYERSKKFFKWDDETVGGLIKQPESPERGQLLETMFLSGIRKFETFALVGMDLSFSHATGLNLLQCSMQTVNMAYSNFARSHIRSSDFRAAELSNTSFKDARIDNVLFGAIWTDELNPPMRSKARALVPTNMPGADFTDAYLENVSFVQASLGAANFDRAVLINVDFSSAAMLASTFRGAIMIRPKLEKSILGFADLDGLLVFEEDFLTKLTDPSSGSGIKVGQYAQEEVSFDALQNVLPFFREFGDDEAFIKEVVGSDRIWRLKRLLPLEPPEKEEKPAQ